MCECGCYQNDVRYWFPAPGGKRYVLTIGSPCEDCETPVGVIVEIMSVKDCELEAIPRLPLSRKRAAAFPLVFPDKLFRRCMRTVCRMFGVRDYYAIPDEIWNKLKAFDPGEEKTNMYELFGSWVRASTKLVERRAAKAIEEKEQGDG